MQLLPGMDARPVIPFTVIPLGQLFSHAWMIQGQLLSSGLLHWYRRKIGLAGQVD